MKFGASCDAWSPKMTVETLHGSSSHGTASTDVWFTAACRINQGPQVDKFIYACWTLCLDTRWLEGSSLIEPKAWTLGWQMCYGKVVLIVHSPFMLSCVWPTATINSGLICHYCTLACISVQTYATLPQCWPYDNSNLFLQPEITDLTMPLDIRWCHWSLRPLCFWR